MTEVTTRLARWETDSALLRQVRTRVFVEEQKVPASLEWDDLDPECVHVIALADKSPIGTGRLTPDGHIGRVAVLNEWRGRGVGDSLIRELLTASENRGDKECVLNAQTHAVQFYARFGFAAEGQEFEEAGIPHRTMRLKFGPQRIAIANQRALEMAAIRVVLNARYRLNILTLDLANPVLTSPRVLNALRRFAVSNSRASVRVLFAHWDRTNQLSHSLVALRAALPSYIQLRRIEDEEINSPAVQLWNDQHDGLKAWHLRNVDAILTMHNLQSSTTYLNLYNPMWERAIEDHNVIPYIL